MSAAAVAKDGLDVITMPAWCADRLNERVPRLLRSANGRPVYGITLCRMIADVSGLPGIPRAVWRAFAEAARSEHLSVPDVAARTGFGESAVRDAIADLTRWGWLACTRPAAGRRPGWYEVEVPTSWDPDADLCTSQKRRQVAAATRRQEPPDDDACRRDAVAKGPLPPRRGGPSSSRGQEMTDAVAQEPVHIAPGLDPPPLVIVPPISRAERGRRQRRMVNEAVAWRSGIVAR